MRWSALSLDTSANIVEDQLQSDSKVCREGIRFSTLKSSSSLISLHWQGGMKAIELKSVTRARTFAEHSFIILQQRLALRHSARLRNERDSSMSTVGSLTKEPNAESIFELWWEMLNKVSRDMHRAVSHAARAESRIARKRRRRQTAKDMQQKRTHTKNAWNTLYFVCDAYGETNAKMKERGTNRGARVLFR